MNNNPKNTILYVIITLVVLYVILLIAFGINYYERGESEKFNHNKAKSGVIQWMLAKSDMPEDELINIYEAANKYPNADLILAIIKTESNFNPYVKSNKNARGLTGIIPEYWLAELQAQGIIQNKRDIFSIEKNIMSCNYILSKYSGKYSNIETVLTNYSGKAKNYSNKIFEALGEIYYAKASGTW